MKSAYPLILVACLLVSGCTQPNPAYQNITTESDASFVDGQPPKADGSGPVRDLRQPPSDTGLVCTPNAFAGCSSPYHMQTCNPAGTGVITVPCAPYLCNQQARRCNQCDPNRPPTCVGDAVHTCSAEGLLVVTNCPHGCDKGQCQQPCTKKAFYKDSDSDGFGDPQQQQQACNKPSGYVENDQDCNDADDQAHPGQSSWFLTPMKGYNANDPLAFDYNCDKAQTQRRPYKHTNCYLKNGTCEGSGWISSYVPACGKPGWWIGCNKTGGGPIACSKSYTQGVQSCH